MRTCPRARALAGTPVAGPHGTDATQSSLQPMPQTVPPLTPHVQYSFPGGVRLTPEGLAGAGK